MVMSWHHRLAHWEAVSTRHDIQTAIDHYRQDNHRLTHTLIIVQIKLEITPNYRASFISQKCI